MCSQNFILLDVLGSLDPSLLIQYSEKQKPFQISTLVYLS